LLYVLLVSLDHNPIYAFLHSHWLR
jgi:hypothetical protein